MVAGLRQAIDHFRSVEPKEARAAWAAGKPIAEALADLDESLARGRREIERISRRLGEDSTLALVDAVDERFRRQSWLRRLLTADYHRQVQNVVRGAGWMRGELLDAIIEGYGLIQARLSRVMAAEQIERIACEGRPVDPERMIVLEVVDDPDRPPGTVAQGAAQRLRLEGPPAPIRRGPGGQRPQRDAIGARGDRSGWRVRSTTPATGRRRQRRRHRHRLLRRGARSGRPGHRGRRHRRSDRPRAH